MIVLISGDSFSFVSSSTTPVRSLPALAVSDFNGDGCSDLAVAHFYSDDVSIRDVVKIDIVKCPGN